MKVPPRRLGLTWIGWLNFLLLQWVGLRLAAETLRSCEVGSEIWSLGLMPAWPLTRWSFLPWSRVPRVTGVRESRKLIVWRLRDDAHCVGIITI